MTTKHILPAGKYYIGDPCYVVADNLWDKLIDSTGCFGLDLENVTNWNDGKFFYKALPCFASGTAYGDGVYRDGMGGKYPVDAGLIGIMPVENCKKSGLNLGRIVEFLHSFEVWEDNGIFHFGHIRIDTN